MNLIISFSGRKDGNCDQIASYISNDADQIVYMRDVTTQPCANCNYECMSGECPYRKDGVYSLFQSFEHFEKIYMIVPMYCGHPSSLYFIMNERSQDFFMHCEMGYDSFINQLYVIGVYGNKEDDPEFEQLFAKQYKFKDPKKHILGLERHKYGHKMKDYLLNGKDVQDQLDKFIKNS